MRYKLLGQQSRLRVSERVNAGGAAPIIGPNSSASAVPLSFPHDMLAESTLQNRLAGGKLDLFDHPSQPAR
ncbi:hypothetical protein [Rhizobium tubonense]|uniref:Uncharacterized protein n=1 Tax=Rhizobium tubonense TaxID=484088 RepID=A0A2W4C7I9_9HYPH|nr:hypothetical protein [Rhizobium tubonense]PZM09462.1 hypothetical protein CPY51_24515 [Rhizobium tubonense]